MIIEKIGGHILLNSTILQYWMIQHYLEIIAESVFVWEFHKLRIYLRYFIVQMITTLYSIGLDGYSKTCSICVSI